MDAFAVRRGRRIKKNEEEIVLATGRFWAPPLLSWFMDAIVVIDKGKRRNFKKDLKK